MSSEFLFKAEPNLPWAIIDADKSDYPTSPLEEIVNFDGMIVASWGTNETRFPIVFRIALTFEGMRMIRGVLTGLFSIQVQPKDSLILRALTERVGRTLSPRDYLKRVVAELARHPMYPGARLDLIGAHYGARGGKRLFMSFSGTAGWPMLVAHRQAEIARHNLFMSGASFWDKLVWWLSPSTQPTCPMPLDPNPPSDPWMESGVKDRIEDMIGGRGLDAGPLRMAGDSLLRKMGRDPRLRDVMRPFEMGGGTIMGTDRDLISFSDTVRSNLTVVQLEVDLD